MPTVRNACFAALIGILPGSFLPVSYVWGQEAATPSAPAETAAADSKVSATGKRDTARAGKGKAGAKPSASRSATDRVNLDATKVVGNRELPKVLYIVPWKRSDLGELPGQPINSLLDEVLAPLDRDEYRREIRYYQAITAPADQRVEAPPVLQSQSPAQSIPTEK